QDDLNGMAPIAGLRAGATASGGLSRSRGGPKKRGAAFTPSWQRVRVDPSDRMTSTVASESDDCRLSSDALGPASSASVTSHFQLIGGRPRNGMVGMPLRGA